MFKVVCVILSFLFLGAAYDASAGGYSQEARAAMTSAVSRDMLPSTVRLSSEAIRYLSVDHTLAAFPLPARKPLPVRYAGKASLSSVVTLSGMAPLAAKRLMHR